MDNIDPYNVLLSIATNIPVLLMTAFVLQGHMINDLRLRASRRNTINAVSVWEHSRVRQLHRNTLTTDFAQAFQNNHNNI